MEGARSWPNAKRGRVAVPAPVTKRQAFLALPRDAPHCWWPGRRCFALDSLHHAGPVSAVVGFRGLGPPLLDVLSTAQPVNSVLYASSPWALMSRPWRSSASLTLNGMI